MKGAGRDCTALFDKYHRWVNFDSLVGVSALQQFEDTSPVPIYPWFRRQPYGTWPLPLNGEFPVGYHCPAVGMYTVPRVPSSTHMH